MAAVPYPAQDLGRPSRSQPLLQPYLGCEHPYLGAVLGSHPSGRPCAELVSAAWSRGRRSPYDGEPEPVEPQPVEPEPVEPEPVDPEPVEPEPIEPDPIEPEDREAFEPGPIDPSVVEAVLRDMCKFFGIDPSDVLKPGFTHTLPGMKRGLRFHQL
jgi:hypothetical protein